MSFAAKYQPKSISEFVFPTAHLERIIKAYTEGRTTTPLLLHGPYGTGKTTLGNLLPYAITNDLQKPDFKILDSSADRSEAKFRNKIDAFSLHYGRNKDGKRYVLIDEVDYLEPKAQQYLRGQINKLPGDLLYILTTNSLDRVDGAIRSRCCVEKVDPADENAWLARAQQILRTENCIVPDEKLLGLLSKAKGDNRKILDALEKVCITRGNQPQPNVAIQDKMKVYPFNASK